MTYFTPWVRAIENGLGELAISLDTTSSIEPAPRPHSVDTDSVYITVSGESNTFMVGLVADAVNQRRLGCMLLGLGPDEPIEAADITDAFGELLNVVVGRIKVDVPETTANLELGLPLHVHGAIAPYSAEESEQHLLQLGETTMTVCFLRMPLAPEAAHRQDEEARRHKAEQELQIAQKLEAVGQLAAGIAHEINTPMQFLGDNIEFLGSAFADILEILGKYSELKKFIADTPEAKQAVEAALESEENAELDFIVEQTPTSFEHCREGVARVSKIVSAMREFGRRDSPNKTLYDLSKVVENTVVVSASEHKQVAHLMCDLGDLPLIPCHPSELSQVVLNIVVNACHAINDQTDTSVTLGKIIIRTYADDEFGIIEIADSGGGIPKSVQPRVFDPFFTTKDVGRGTGQRLAIARSIVVDKHQGQLDFEVEEGVGTTFFIRIPRTDQALSEDEEAA